MTVDMVFCFSPIGELIYEAADIDHRVGRFLEELLDSVDPNIDISIQLFNWIFSQR
jgi:hypothetical protein